jgi:putative spermidine/putrescine transport system permease protein
MKPPELGNPHILTDNSTHLVQRKPRLQPQVYLWMLGGLSVVITIIPLIYLMVSSLAGPWPFPQLLPQTWTARGQRFIFLNLEDIIQSLGSSLGFSLGTVLLALGWTWLPAKFLAYNQFRLKPLLESLVLAPAVLPTITFAPGSYQILLRLGLADNVLGIMIMLSVIGAPYLLRSLKIGFINYPKHQTDTALNLGASRAQVFFRIEVPALLPSIFSGATLVFLTGFSEYFLVFLIGGGIVPSFTGYLVPFLTSGDQAISGALTQWFLILPLILLGIQELILQRYYGKRKKIYETQST